MSPLAGGTLRVVVRPREAPAELLDPASSELLVQRAQQGDRDAFGALYDRFAPTLFGAAVRMLGGRREANDLVHDVFLEAWQHVRDYDPQRGSVRTWLLLRLRSRALDLLGTAEARHTRLGDGREEHEREVSPLQEHALEQASIRRALAGLEADVRAVLDQTYFAGLTAREIAERSGLPLGTVKSRLARGLAALEATLREARRADG